MRCVCPMGGDRTCPDDCPTGAYWSLSDDDRPARRKATAVALFKKDLTQEQIATQLGVTQQQISKYLINLQPGCKSKPAKTKRNPKGAGRPKGRKKEPGVKQAQRSVNTTPEQWKQFKRQAVAEGFDSAAAKLGALIAEPEIARADLSLSAQQKFDAAVRQHQRRLDLVFENRVLEEINQRLDHIILPVWRKKIADAKKIYDNRRSITNRETFNIILKCLHTDTRTYVSHELVNDAFTRFMALEKYLLNEKDSPTKFTGLPTTPAEWEQRKQEAAAIRRAKRGHSNVGKAR